MTEITKRSNKSIWVTEEFRKKFGKQHSPDDVHSPLLEMQSNQYLSRIKKTLEAIYSKNKPTPDVSTKPKQKELKVIRSAAAISEKPVSSIMGKTPHFNNCNELFLPNGLKYPGKERDHSRIRNKSKACSMSKGMGKSALSNTKRSLKLNYKATHPAFGALLESQPYLNGVSRVVYSSVNPLNITSAKTTSNRGLIAQSLFVKDLVDNISKKKEKQIFLKTKKPTAHNPYKDVTEPCAQKPRKTVQKNSLMMKSNFLKRQKSAISKGRGESTSIKAKSCGSAKRKSSLTSEPAAKKHTVKKLRRFESSEGLDPYSAFFSHTFQTKSKRKDDLVVGSVDGLELRKKSKSFTHKAPPYHRNSIKAKKSDIILGLKAIIDKKHIEKTTKQRCSRQLSQKYKQSLVQTIKKPSQLLLKKKTKESISHCLPKSERVKRTLETPKAHMLAQNTHREKVESKTSEFLGCNETKLYLEPSTKLTEKSQPLAGIQKLQDLGGFRDTREMLFGSSHSLIDVFNSNLPVQNQSSLRLTEICFESCSTKRCTSRAATT